MPVLLTIPFKEKNIPAKIDSVNESPEFMKKNIWIVLTHGAGGDMNTPQLTAIATFLSQSDFVVFRFTCKGLNIKYRIKVYLEMLKYICKVYDPKGIFIGGRSMGARTAVMLQEEDVCASIFDKILGIICLSYPLHKINQINNLRDEPLKQCHKPLFFLSGTKDEMCTKELLEKVAFSLKTAHRIHWLEGCDHSAKSIQNFEDKIHMEGLKALSMWCTSISNKKVQSIL